MLKYPLGVAFLFVSLAAGFTEAPRQKNGIVSYGCFNALAAVVSSESQHMFNSVGLCLNQCRGQGAAVAALRESACYCANLYPAKLARIEDHECDAPCPGYPADLCGSARGHYSVYSTDPDAVVQNDVDTSSVFTWYTEKTRMGDAASSVYEMAAGWTKSVQDFFYRCLGRREGRGGNGGKQSGISYWARGLKTESMLGRALMKIEGSSLVLPGVL